MSAIDDFLAACGRRLLVRRRARAEILEEMRGHLEALEAERGPFQHPTAIERAFGDPRAIATRINAAVPWTQARMPWSLAAIGPLVALAASLATVLLTCAIAPWLDSGAAALLWTCAATCSWLSYLAGPLAALAYGVRLGARPGQIATAVLLPSLLSLGWYADTSLRNPTLQLEPWQSRCSDALAVLVYLAISWVLARAVLMRSSSMAGMRMAIFLTALAVGAGQILLSGAPGCSLTWGQPAGLLVSACVVLWLMPRLLAPSAARTAAA